MRRALALSVLALLCGCAPLAPTPTATPTLAPAAAPAPVDRKAIRGHIVTPEGVIRNGWLVVQGNRIASIGEAQPDLRGASVLETDDYVFPTFVDLHNHPMYNMFPRWKAPKEYGSRYEWRAAPEYLASIANPQRALIATSFCDMDQFAEVQMLIAGTGATTGISPPRDGIPKCVVGLVRNLDLHSGLRGDEPGKERVRTLLGVGKDLTPERKEEALKALKANSVDALVVHLAEGKRSDADTRKEFALLAENDLLVPQVVLVHAIALDEKDFARMAPPFGASLVWSPRSNFELYGETLDVRAALRHGIPVAIAPDWAPTGSINMLEELRYARRYSREALGDAITAKQLFEMATLVPARIAKLDGMIGSLAVDKRADLFLARSRGADPYESLVASPVTDISLVMIDGVPLYGEAARLKAMQVPTEDLDVCGARRALNASSFAAGTFQDMVKRLTDGLRNLNVSISPLADC